VYDLVGGRAAWTVLGLPTEGSVGDRRRISQFVVQPGIVPIEATIADIVADGAQPEWPVAVLGDGRVLLGALQSTARRLPSQTPVQRAMQPAPATIRPDVRIERVIEQLTNDDLDHVFVTTASGKLVGLAVRELLHV